MSACASHALLAALLLAAPGLVCARDIVDLQAARQASSMVTADGHRVELTNLAPAIDAWYLLRIDGTMPGGRSWHLENRVPRRQSFVLDGKRSSLVVHLDGEPDCVIRLAPPAALQEAGASRLPFAPLCDGRVAVRNPLPGHRTALEATTEFLRDRLWGGERLVGFVKHTFYQDAFALRDEARASASAPAPLRLTGTPPPPRLAPAATQRPLSPSALALDIGAARRRLRPGDWWPVTGRPGVFVMALTPADLPTTDGIRAEALELDALDYFVAFDLARFDVGFELGTEHPRLGWSDRAPDAMRDAALPGPDGLASAVPLVRAGAVDPALSRRLVATFTGGFKREHGAFAHGRLATMNHASHYGFVEQGVVFSSLQPGLSTLFATADGRVDLRTWPEHGAPASATLRFARQNGVPLVESASGIAPRIGDLVRQWGAGNWSGSADEQERTLRAGACLLENGGHRFLVYGWFSTATPLTMARGFLALGCRDAMHLDMNALEHTYLALYVREGQRLGVQHLVDGMAVLDRGQGPAVVPRFLGFPDDRDFFYVVEKTTPP